MSEVHAFLHMSAWKQHGGEVQKKTQRHGNMQEAFFLCNPLRKRLAWRVSWKERHGSNVNRGGIEAKSKSMKSCVRLFDNLYHSPVVSFTDLQAVVFQVCCEA